MKTTEQNNKLKHAIILSIVLHFILIVTLVWNSIRQSQEKKISNGSYIDAMIIDPSIVTQQYSRQKKTDVQYSHQQIEKTQQNQTENHNQLKEKQKYLSAQKVSKVQHRQQADQQKQTEKKIIVKTKKVEVNKKSNIDQSTKEKVTTKRPSEVDDLLDRLSDFKNSPKNNDPSAKKKNSNQNNDIGSEVSSYLARMRQAISNKFYDASNYIGKTCILHIELTPDGILTSISSDNGDPMLCQEAISAAKLAEIPKPPNQKVYKVVKNVTLDFKP